MNLYYTVSNGQDETQPKVFASIGGYKSNTILKNDEFNGMFSEISIYSVKKNRKEYLGLILKNETGADITNLKVWFEYGNKCYSLLKISAVDLLTDSNSIQYLERIQDRYSKPIRAIFYEADGETNAVDLGDMLENSTIGIWFERSLNISVIETDFDIDNRVTKNGNVYVETPLDTEDVINIVFDWS